MQRQNMLDSRLWQSLLCGTCDATRRQAQAFLKRCPPPAHGVINSIVCRAEGCDTVVYSGRGPFGWFEKWRCIECALDEQVCPACQANDIPAEAAAACAAELAAIQQARAEEARRALEAEQQGVAAGMQGLTVQGGKHHTSKGAADVCDSSSGLLLEEFQVQEPHTHQAKPAARARLLPSFHQQQQQHPPALTPQGVTLLQQDAPFEFSDSEAEDMDGEGEGSLQGGSSAGRHASPAAMAAAVYAANYRDAHVDPSLVHEAQARIKRAMPPQPMPRNKDMQQS